MTTTVYAGKSPVPDAAGFHVFSFFSVINRRFLPFFHHNKDEKVFQKFSKKFLTTPFASGSLALPANGAYFLCAFLRCLPHNPYPFYGRREAIGRIPP
jgi:hypothetical protein